MGLRRREGASIEEIRPGAMPTTAMTQHRDPGKARWED
jgi:hypothetical protein